MAFLPTKDDKKDETPQAAGQQAPALNSGGSFNGGPSAMTPNMGGGTPPAQQAMSTQNAGRSGRFTNLQTVLGQNTGLGKQVNSTAASDLNNFANDRNGALDPLRKASFQGNTNFQPTLDVATREIAPDRAPVWHMGEGYTSVDPGTGVTAFDPGEDHSKEREDQAGAWKQLKDLLSQSYTGPDKVLFDASGNSNLRKLDQLGDARTIGAQLADPNASPYNVASGVGRLDQALYGTADDSRASMAGAKTASGDVKKATTDEVSGLNQNVDNIRQSYQNTNAAVRAGLGAYADNIYSTAQQQADAANTASNNDFANGTGTWEGAAPNSASAGNFVTGNTANNFNQLQALLGGTDQTLSSTGPYTAGHYTQQVITPEDPPKSEPFDNSKPYIVSPRDEVMQKDLSGFDDGQKTAYFREYYRLRDLMDPTNATNESYRRVQTGESKYLDKKK